MRLDTKVLSFERPDDLYIYLLINYHQWWRRDGLSCLDNGRDWSSACCKLL